MCKGNLESLEKPSSDRKPKLKDLSGDYSPELTKKWSGPKFSWNETVA